MAEIIKFPYNSKPEKESEELELEERTNQLATEIETLEATLTEMATKTGGSMTGEELTEDANELISWGKVELAKMRDRKFYSPINRRGTLERLKELRIIFRTANSLWEEYENKENELIDLMRKLDRIKGK